MTPQQRWRTEPRMESIGPPNDLALLTELARVAGYLLVPVHQGRAGDLHACLAAWSQEIDQTKALASEVFGTGRISAMDAGHLEAQVRSLAENGRSLAASLRTQLQHAGWRVRPPRTCSRPAAAL
ncbi:hypothetical protein BKE38_01955 [Pseudoroseomonas deserti]|uniref:Uncharacterized protein n=1 Tax=Teichococcus deserti TaxID=1817963 RepID=A0A1V2H9S4_9PROT|nr:hypothetical protein [Pseudoroseomonas deserti]ONG58820.1 hypothetical protein BKE38_01955 [Pseudoroseomonas deserti]